MADERAGTVSGSGTGTDRHAEAFSDRASERYIALSQPHLGAVLRLATALMGPADAEDVAQEAILRGMQAWPTLRDEGAFKSWLLHIVYHVCLDLKRGRFGTHQARRQPLPEGEEEALSVSVGGDLGGSDHAAALDLRAAIQALEAGLRTVVVLRYYVGMDATAIGAILGLPPATVRTRLRRALTVLRQDLHVHESVPIIHPEKGGR
jgi:RNA polymerase sigma-70 factor (ECF subfamily)